MKISALICCILAFANFSCEKALESNQPLIIPINTCLDKKANKESIEFCFDQLLEDSRCPINAVCVWQGVAKAKFSLKINGETKTFELSTLNMPPYYRTDTTLNGYKIKLTNISPPAGETGSKTMAELEINW
jgi:hypothetical protein